VQSQQERQANFVKKEAEFIKQAPDYDQVVANVPKLAQEALDVVMHTGDGPQLAYYLGKHLDVADDVASLSPAMAAMKLGQISAQLSATVNKTVTSAAPEPIVPVESGGSLSKSDEDKSIDEIVGSHNF